MTLVDTDQAPVETSADTSEARPFLKWAGGKSRLLAELCARIPKTFGRYFEPFVGGGALFFELQPERAVLSDINPEIVNAYQVVRDHVEELIADLSRHRHTKKYFYKIREADRHSDYWVLSEVEKASRLIYLNKTCFNGLYRVNSRGEFNVPFGDYKSPCIVDVDNLQACSAALQHADLRRGSFEEIESEVSKGDFVYLDPPYVPSSKTSSFTAYYRDGFGADGQADLAEFCRRLAKKGAYFLLSNSDVPLVRELYAEFELETVLSSRPINAKAEKRGVVPELLVRNYEAC